MYDTIKLKPVYNTTVPLMTGVFGGQNLHHRWDSLGETAGTQNVSRGAGPKVRSKCVPQKLSYVHF